jgi:hypothetical protein
LWNNFPQLNSFMEMQSDTPRQKLPGSADDLSQRLAIVCAYPAEAAAIAAFLQNCRRTHFGLFAGYCGRCGAFDCDLIISGEGENLAYGATRQIAYIAAPRILINAGIAGALTENLRTGDIVFLQSTRRAYCPPVILDNMLHDDELVWPDNEIRAAVVNSPALAFDTADVAKIQPKLVIPQAQPPHILLLDCASMQTPLADFRGREFVRTRFGAQVADMESYGFLLAARDASTPAIAIKVISDDCRDSALTEVLARIPKLAPILGQSVSKFAAALVTN